MSGPEQPSILPHSFVADLARRLDEEGVFVFTANAGSTLPTITKGARLKFSQKSPFAGLDAICAESTTDERVRVLFECLGTQSLIVGRDQVEVCK